MSPQLTINQRFERVVNELISRQLVESQTDLAEKMGYKSKSSITGMINGDQNPTSKVITALSNKWNVNPQYILTGQGSMFTDGTKDTPPKPRSPFRDAIDIGAWNEDDPTEEHRGKEFVDLGNGRYRVQTLLVTHVASMGYLRGYADPEWLEELPKHSITVDRIPSGIYRTFIARGESMDDGSKRSIEHGSKVTGRVIRPELYKDSRLHLHKFQVFIIVHKEGITIKEIINHDVEKGKITIHSWNPDKNEFPDVDLDLRDVLQLLNVVKIERDL